MTGSAISRRDLLRFGAAARRRFDRDVETSADDAPPAGRGPSASVNGPAAVKAAARRHWSEGDPRALLGRLAPAAARLAEAAAPEPGARVLDAAAGDGNLALAIAARGCAVAAVDLSPQMVERGSARTADCQAIAWHEGDVEALPFPDGCFDAVLSSFGAIWAPSPSRAVGELKRVCRPGGRIGLAAWTPSGFMGRVVALGRAATGWPRGVPPPERWGRYETAYLHLFELEELDVVEAELVLRFADADELWGVLASPPGPLAPALGAAPAREEPIRAELMRLVEQHGRGTSAGLEVTATYALLLARRPRWA